MLRIFFAWFLAFGVVLVGGAFGRDVFWGLVYCGFGRGCRRLFFLLHGISLKVYKCGPSYGGIALSAQSS